MNTLTPKEVFYQALTAWITALRTGSRRLKEDTKANLVSARTLYAEGNPRLEQECDHAINHALFSL